jgi:glycosyltransferase involved in cell wall biosynthesis
MTNFRVWFYSNVVVNIFCILVLVFSPIRFIRRLIIHQKKRSIWAGTPIITMSINSRAERLLGINSKSLVYNTYFITDAFDYNFSRWSSVPILGKLLPLFVFIWACLVVDILHFYCDRGLLLPRAAFKFDFRELYIYRLLRIHVFLWTYGADVRSRVISCRAGEPNCCTGCDDIGKYCLCDEQKRSKIVNKLSKLSTSMFSGVGDMFDYTPGSINNTYYWPIDIRSENGNRYKPVYPAPSGNKPLRIVHSSNHRIFKGTDYLIRAVNELKDEKIEVELVLVEKVPNDKAIEIYRSADVIFDQCLMGNYGYFALEGMALGKPVMCFIRKPEEYLLHPEECPIIYTHVNTLKQDIRNLTRNREELRRIGIRGRQYIEKYFTLESFASRLGEVYKKLQITP